MNPCGTGAVRNGFEIVWENPEIAFLVFLVSEKVFRFQS